MSTILPYDIIALIIDTVGENNDSNLLKKLALVSHSSLQICRKHLFATVKLCDAIPERHVAIVNLLKNRPDVVKYIRKLQYTVASKSFQSPPTCPSNKYDHLLSSTLPNLNCLTFTAFSMLDWNTLDSSLTSSFLHFMHLPTINHIDLSCIRNFPLSSLNLSVNLRRLNIYCLDFDGSPEFVVQSEMPKILEFHTSDSTLLTSKLLHAKRQDGQPAFNFMDLRRLSIYLTRQETASVRYLLQNAKSLEKLHFSVGDLRSLVGLLSLSARTLKVLDLEVPLYDYSLCLPEAWLHEELEAMAGHNMLEVLSLDIEIFGDEEEDFVGSLIQKVEKVLAKPGWSALRQVSLKVSILLYYNNHVVDEGTAAELAEALQYLPDKYLSHLPKLESVAFNYSVCPDKDDSDNILKYEF